MTPPAAVIGALNIDLILQSLPHFARPGEQVNGPEVRLSPGGKGRNIAAMLAAWLVPGKVSMVGKLVADERGLFQIPLESLKAAGVNVDNILIDRARPTDLPTLSIFLNRVDGKRASYYLPGENESLSPIDIDQVRPLLAQIAEAGGILLMTLEMPLTTAVHILEIAAELDLRVMLDPGGQPPQVETDFSPLFEHPIAWLKPNAAEARRLTGVRVHDLRTANRAAKRLLDKGVEHVLITNGEKGAYGFSQEETFHLLTPELDFPPEAESTGCGDQTLAVLCAATLQGKTFREAAEMAVLAGSLQYIQTGLEPIRPEQVDEIN
ncbi:bifunctional hydroxymethylpyrimidine kinase/phosphomethylpyrimidine kinase [bacterium]|nr:bifunctional hydroxymethylpyrimidine kinase/phosphomethylpyrimidine kinase [bacterium]